MRIVKWTGIILGSLLLLLVLLLVLLDWNWARGYVARELSQRTGRSLTIAGDLDIDWSLTPRIHAEQIRLENASWSQEPYMLELAMLEFRIDLLALLSGRVVMPELILSKPRLVLETSPQGQPNWLFTADPEAEMAAETAVPEERAEFPVINRLQITDGHVLYRDLPNDTQITATIATVRGQGGADETLELQARGKLQGESISLDMHAGTVLQLRQAETPYPVTLQLHTASTTLQIAGTMRQPLQLKGPNLTLNMQGEGRLTLAALAGFTLPELPSYHLQGRVSQDDKAWQLSDLQASLGQSEITGHASIDTTEKRPFLQASLTSQTLDVAQLLALFGAEQASTVQQPADAAMVIDVQLLRALDANLNWQVKELILPQGPMRDVLLSVELQEGRLHIEPLQIAIGDGRLRLQAVFDASSIPVQGTAQIHLEQVDVDQALSLLGMDTARTGVLEGTLKASLAPSDEADRRLTPASLLQRLHVDTSNLSYRDVENNSEINATLRTEQVNGTPTIRLEGEGRYHHQPVAFTADADPLARLADQQQPYTVAAQATLENTQAQLHLSLGGTSAASDMAVQVAVEGKDLAELSPLLGTSLPALSNFQLQGEMQRSGDTWSIASVTATAAGIELRGKVTIQNGGQRPLMRVDLTVDTFHVQPLLDSLAASPSTAAAPSNSTAAASPAINLAPLRAVDAVINLRAPRIDAPNVPLEDVVLHAELRRGKLRAQPLTFQMNGGKITADIKLDATDWPLHGSIHTTIQDLQLGKVLQSLAITDQSLGVLSGTLNLAVTSVDTLTAGTEVILPFLGRLAMTDSQLTYKDQAKRIDIEASVDSERSAKGAQMVSINAQGQYKGEAFTLRFRGDPLLDLRQTQTPYTLDTTIKAVETELHVEGQIAQPLKFQGVDVRLAIAGPNPQQLSDLLGLPLPELPPYQVQGNLRRQEKTWKFLDVDGRVGDSDLTGDIQVDTSGPRPFLRANLASQTIDFDDLGPLIGVAPGTGPAETESAPQAREAAAEEASTTVLPKDQINFGNLQRLDASIKLRGKHLASTLPLDDLSANLTLQDGRLTLAPLDFGVADGTIHSRIELDATGQPARTRFDIEVRHVKLNEIVARFDIAEESAGLIGGRAKVWVQGNSVAEMLASADGGLLLMMTGGQLDHLLIELAGLDLGEAVATLFGDRKDVKINCAFADLHAKKGITQLSTFVVDTDDTIFLGQGSIDLENEQLDLIIDPKPKDLSLFSARAPLYIEGSFADPNIRPGKSALIRGAASLALLPAAPLAALLPLLETDDPPEEAYCSGLVEAINKAR